MSNNNVDINLFEYATRNKLRFPSIRGELSLEQLWDVPLRASDDFNLDRVARTANKVYEETDGSFVTQTPTAAHIRAKMVLEVIKRVIEVKLDDEAKAEKRSKNKKEKEKLLEILAKKQDGKLDDMSEKDLQKRIAALSAED